MRFTSCARDNLVEMTRRCLRQRSMGANNGFFNMVTANRTNGATAVVGNLIILPAGCTVPVGGLVVGADAGPGAGVTETFTVFKSTTLASPGANTVATTATCSLSGAAATTCTNAVAGASYAAGDYLTLQLTFSGTVGTQNLKMAVNCR